MALAKLRLGQTSFDQRAQSQSYKEANLCGKYVLFELLDSKQDRFKFPAVECCVRAENFLVKQVFFLCSGWGIRTQGTGETYTKVCIRFIRPLSMLGQPEEACQIVLGPVFDRQSR